ncbi:hypothetical protein F5887DRAFT_1072925 [Amanita rubescens]|nr:hypothetical protein F5887DRAFT_1073691 [Amanita rubescens]KAF8346828.1 hypothetical protein F5887DRAFT_1072925 [Amanita rubescens]
MTNSNRLSKEILERIFVELVPPASCAKPPDCTRDRRRHPPKLHKDNAAVSWVCSDWRWHAVRYKNLWASITIPGRCHPHLKTDVDEPDVGEPCEPWWTWAKVLMQRSGEAPLFVCLDLGYVGEAHHCQVIRNCLPRIKGLCIHASGLSESSILDVLNNGGAPQLETLSLDLTGAGSRLVRCRFQQGALFNAPRLTQLKLKPGIAVLRSAPLSHLTRFTVVHRGKERTQTPGNQCYNLHEELCSMTSLEFLEIDSESSDELDWRGRRKIQFEHLREIVIKDSLHNCRQILAKTVVPAGCTAKIVVFHEGDHVVGNDIMNELVRHWMRSMGIGRNGYVNGRVPAAGVERTDDGQVLRMRVPSVVG